MLMRTFWKVVERARAECAGDDGWASASAIGDALSRHLEQMSLDRILEFHDCYERARAQTHRWEMVAAAYLIWGSISDDSFTDFQGGLVSLGRRAFDQIVADPDSLAEHPLVQAIAARQAKRELLAGESVHTAASSAYSRKTDDMDAYWEALEERRDQNAPTRGDDGGWDRRFGGADDREQVPSRLPRLHALMSRRP
jgi:hypothetical protein